MGTHSRTHFVLLATTAYAMFSLAWIFLSDELLTSYTDVSAMVWLSTAKGIFYVTVSSALFFMALRAVPDQTASLKDAREHALSLGSISRTSTHWSSYVFAVALPLSLLMVWVAISKTISNESLMIMLMLPIIISALLGGIWPGILATAVSAVIVLYMALPPRNSFVINSALDRLQWVFLISNGLAVSILSNMLRNSLSRADAQRALLNAVVSGTSDAVFVKDISGRYLLINDAGAQVVGQAATAIIGQDDSSIFPPETAQNLINIDRTIMAAGKTDTHEETVTRHGAQPMAFLVTKGPVKDSQGQVVGLFGISKDITARKQAELAQKEAATVFENSYEGIMMVSPDRIITRVNPAFTRITGYTPSEAQGQSPRLLSSGRHGPDFYEEIWHSIHTHGVWRGEIFNKRKCGEIYPEMLSISAVPDAQGNIQHYIGVFWDISQIKAQEAALDRIAHYDPLTGSPNRHLLSRRLDQAISRANRLGRSLAVCFLDLDEFKVINDKHSPTQGDQLLVGVAANLQQILRADDTLARLGGDEFVLLLSDIADLQECERLLKRVLAAVNLPVVLGDTPVSITASMGVSLYPHDQVDADTLLRHADQAMYLAKEEGRNRFHLFDPESNRQAQQHRLYLAELHQALDQNEFVLYYQPKVDLINGDIVGVEALLRWQSPVHGLVSPAQFLPDIDGSALETPIGEWVIKTMLKQASIWQHQGYSLHVSANVSANHLLSNNFYTQLQQALAQQPDVSPSHIELEVLETAAIRDMDMAVTTLMRCRELGIQFSLDDFGTGYSSLTYLRKLPVNLLKIDQSFVRGMLDNPDDLSIVQSVVQLAKSFNRGVIAEGVETMAHGAALVQLGCRMAQGYGIAKPMPAEQFPEWCEQWKIRQAWCHLGE